MSRVWKKSFTKPIPADAVRTTMKVVKRGRTDTVPAVKFKGTNGRMVTAPIVQSGKGAGVNCRVETAVYYACINGETVSLGKETKPEAETERAKRLLEAGQAPDPHAAERDKPLADHVTDYLEYMKNKGVCASHLEQARGKLTAFLVATGAARLADLSVAKANRWLSSLRDPKPLPAVPDREFYTYAEAAAILKVSRKAVGMRVRYLGLPVVGQTWTRRLPRESLFELVRRTEQGIGPVAMNQYSRCLRSFSRWLVFPGNRVAANPLEGLLRVREATDLRHERRDLSEDDLSRILDAARSSKRVLRGLTGEDRYHLYLTAMATGFRASGLASLTPASFNLDGDPPVVTLSAMANKSKKLKLQPIPVDAADQMREHLKGKPPGRPVWPGPWARHKVSAYMLRIDLKAAGVPYVTQTADGPRFADFHALRHTYLTMLSRKGVDLRTLQELAGHSSPTITAKYVHRDLDDLSAAVGKLPKIGSAACNPLANGPDSTTHSDGKIRHRRQSAARAAAGRNV